MALTESTMVELGSAAPAFSLPDTVSGSTVSFDSVAGEHGTLVMFICAHCPFVIHVQDELARIGQDYSAKPVGIVAISANDAVTHPQDAPENLKKMAETLGFEFPYCYDESQAVARSYGAACTPDFFLFDGAGKLAYRGQLDDSRPGNDALLDGKDLRAALDAVLAGEPVSPEQRPSVGCNIKWRAGNG